MFCRIVNRNDFTPNYRIIDVGFRLIKTIKSWNIMRYTEEVGSSIKSTAKLHTLFKITPTFTTKFLDSG